MSTLQQKIKTLPQSPGVYIFYGGRGSARGGFRKAQILYVGKAASLKDRVSSYFQNRGGAVRPIEMFISEVKDLEIRKTDTVLEAFILEQELIKKLQPKYNAMGKDDRSFCYVVVTKEDFPRLVVMRRTEVDQISNSKFLISNKSSNTKIQIPNKFKIQNSCLAGRQAKFKIKSDRIYGPYTSRRQIETVLKILRKIFPYHSRSEKSEKMCFDYHIGLCPGPYDGKISKILYRKNIQAIQMILEGKKKNLINKMKKEMEACSKKQDYECAAKLRNQMFALKHVQDIALISQERNENFQFPISNFQSISNDQISKLKTIRIEAYDISNISGKFATGSMAVFDNSDDEYRPNKSQYRKFRIRTIIKANDVGAMEEMLMRRFKNNWPLPNLIILDGGRGHLNMARKVLRIYHLEIPLLAVAKGPTRKKLDFYPHTYNKDIKIEGIKNEKNNLSRLSSRKSVGVGVYSYGSIPEIEKNIIEQIRDEAHRFAITYHRKLRRKEIRNQEI